MKDHETVETVPEIEPLCGTNVLETPTEDGNVQGRARLWLVVLCGSFAIVSGGVISPSAKWLYNGRFVELESFTSSLAIFHIFHPLHQVFPSTQVQLFTRNPWKFQSRWMLLFSDAGCWDLLDMLDPN